MADAARSGLARLRNIGIAAHIDAGKTTVSERILYYTGVEHRMGEVHEGTTVMDWMAEERRRGITITAAATTVPWLDHVINLIDTPGHVDFTVEVERCLRVLDGAVLLLNGVAGVQAQSETVWRQMRRHGVPYLVFVNQCDRAGADFFRCLSDLETRLGVKAVALQLPLGKERGFRSLVDLVTSTAWEFPEERQGKDPRRIPVPESAADEVAVLRADLFERLAELDEAVFNAVVEEREPEPDVVRAALRRAVLAHELVPALCGAALRNVGVQPLIDAVVHYLPSPLDVPPVRGVDPLAGGAVERRAAIDEPTCALAFKLAADAHEELTFVRIYSGSLRPGQKLYNSRVKRMERVARVLRMHAEARTALEQAGPGEIVALSGCRFTVTGDTLCDREQPITLEPHVFPDPVISLVVEPRASADRDKLRATLERLVHEDPTFRAREDEETGQWRIAGMGELHLEVVLNRAREEFGVDVVVGKPRVAYREAIRRSGRGSGRIDKVLGGKALFGAVDVELEPRPEAATVELVHDEDCRVPPDLREAVSEALRMGAESGPRFGFPLVHTRIRVQGGDSSPGRDAEAGFRQAAALALREALDAAEVELLEPLMSFSVDTPAEFLSGILADLNGSGAEVRDLRVEGDQRQVVGVVPMVRMFGYATTLRSLSQGRASFSLTPAGFRAVPEAELAARGLVWT